MTLFAAHARHLTEPCPDRGCQLIIGYPWNYNPHVLRVKEVIASGRLGGIRYINNMFASSVISLYRGDDSVHDNLYQYPVTGPGDVYSDPERSGGGQGHLQATHSVGRMLHMTGLRRVSVLAFDEQSRYAGGCRQREDRADGQRRAGQCRQYGHAACGAAQSRRWLCRSTVTEGGSTPTLSTGTVQFTMPIVTSRSCRPRRRSRANCRRRRRTTWWTSSSAARPTMSPAEVRWHTVLLLDAAYRSAADEGRRVSVSSLYGDRS